MTITVKLHEALFSIMQTFLNKLFAAQFPHCHGYTLFCISKLDEDIGPRTTIITNLKNKHSVKLMLEVMKQHVYDHEREFGKDAELGGDAIWELLHRK